MQFHPLQLFLECNCLINWGVPVCQVLNTDCYLSRLYPHTCHCFINILSGRNDRWPLEAEVMWFLWKWNMEVFTPRTNNSNFCKTSWWLLVIKSSQAISCINWSGSPSSGDVLCLHHQELMWSWANTNAFCWKLLLSTYVLPQPFTFPYTILLHAPEVSHKKFTVEKGISITLK